MKVKKYLMLAHRIHTMYETKDGKCPDCPLKPSCGFILSECGDANLGEILEKYKRNKKILKKFEKDFKKGLI